MTVAEMKAKYEAGEINADELIAFVTADNKRLEQALDGAGDLRMKVSDKGALSIYGLGRFPITLYKSQWKRLLAHAKAIVDFLEAHDSELASKADKKAA